MYLPIEMKKEILHGTMTAFISNEIQCNIDSEFSINESSNGLIWGYDCFCTSCKKIAEAKCLGIFKFEYFVDSYTYKDFYTFKNETKDGGVLSIRNYSLGINETDNLEEKFNFKTSGYLHIFKVIEIVENKE